MHKIEARSLWLITPKVQLQMDQGFQQKKPMLRICWRKNQEIPALILMCMYRSEYSKQDTDSTGKKYEQSGSEEIENFL